MNLKEKRRNELENQGNKTKEEVISAALSEGF